MGPYYCHTNIQYLGGWFVDAPDDDMEEPVECPGCQKWGELQVTRTCEGCKELFCPQCLTDGHCANCFVKEDQA